MLGGGWKDVQLKVDFVMDGSVMANELQTLHTRIDEMNTPTQSSLSTKADVSELTTAVSDLEAAIAAAKTAANDYTVQELEELNTALTAAIASAKAEAVTAAETMVNKAKHKAIEAAKNQIPHIGTNGN